MFIDIHYQPTNHAIGFDAHIWAHQLMS